MVHNSTNINKWNIHLSPQTIEHKKTIAYVFRSPGLSFRQAQKCGGVEPVNGIPPLIIGSPTTIQV
jgi:hypothetical protein